MCPSRRLRRSTQVVTESTAVLFDTETVLAMALLLPGATAGSAPSHGMSWRCAPRAAAAALPSMSEVRTEWRRLPPLGGDPDPVDALAGLEDDLAAVRTNNNVADGPRC